jgi:hypothetical protein
VRRRAGGLGVGLALLALGAAEPPGAVWAVGEDPVAEVTEALQALGPPGLLWGRVAVEEESPVGPWTPLEGIEVTLYPATPSLIAELEQIRQSARGSGTQYESAVARVQAALAVHQGRIDRQNALTPEESLLVAEPPLLPPFRSVTLPGPRSLAPASAKGAATSTKAGSGGAASTKAAPLSPRGTPSTTTGRLGSTATPGATGESRPEPPHPWRRKTDPAGLFVFATVPSGDWLVVALRVAPYAAEKLRAEPKTRQPTRGRGFLPRAVGPAKEAEIWVTRVRVPAADRVGLELSDRARWLAGPVR